MASLSSHTNSRELMSTLKQTTQTKVKGRSNTKLARNLQKSRYKYILNQHSSPVFHQSC